MRRIKITRKLFFISFIFIVLFSISIYAIPTSTFSSIIYNESFTYTDQYSSHGWTFTSTTGDIDRPVGNVKGLRNYAFGSNRTVATGSTAETRIRYTLTNPVNLSTTPSGESIIVRFNNSNLFDSVVSNGYGRMIATAKTGISAFTFYYGSNSSGATTCKECYWFDSQMGGQDCNYNSGSAFNTYTVTIQLDYLSNIYNVWLNDTLICDQRTLYSTARGLYRFQFGFTRDTGENLTVAIDDIEIAYGTVAGTSSTLCEFPQIFCDNFNYETSIRSTRDWAVTNIDLSINNAFSPNGSVLVWNRTNPEAISHTVNSFSVNYPISDSVNLTTSTFAPKFSNQFDIKFFNTSGASNLVEFKTFDTGLRLCSILRFESNKSNGVIDVKFLNITTNQYNTWGTITAGETHSVVFVHNFNLSTPFNSSNLEDDVNLFIDNGAFHFAQSKLHFPDCTNIYQSAFIINSTSHVEIDNYYAVVGTDRFIDSSSLDFTPLFVPDPALQIGQGASGTTDFAESVTSIWDDFGLHTALSRTIFGVLLMFMLGLFIFFGTLKLGANVSFGALLILETIFAIFLVIIGLLPIWVIFILVLMGVGLVALFIKFFAQ